MDAWFPPEPSFSSGCDYEIAAVSENAVEHVENRATQRIDIRLVQFGAAGAKLLNVTCKVRDTREALGCPGRARNSTRPFERLL